MSFALSAVFMILVFWRPQEWLAPQLYGLPILDAVVFLAILSYFIEVSEKVVRPPSGILLGLIAGLWVATIMSHVAHTYFAGVMATYAETGKICIFAGLMLCVTNRISRVRAIAKIFVTMACIMSIHALMQDLTGHGFRGQVPILVQYTGQAPFTRTRFFGIFGDPNDLAQILATAVPLVFAIPRRLSMWKLLFAGAVTGLLVAAMLTTHSRGGFVAIAAVGVVMLLLALPTRWLPVVTPVLFALVLFACGRWGGEMLDPSARDRVVFWGMANQVFKRNLLFGIGYGMFWQVARERAAHNAFVSCYTELGLFGYWFWYGLLQLGIVGCYRVRVSLRQAVTGEQRYLRRVSGLCIAAMSGYAASAYFLSRTWVYPCFFLFGLLNAIPLIVQRVLPDGHRPLIRAKRDVFVMGSVGVVVSILYIYISIVLLNKAYGA